MTEPISPMPTRTIGIDLSDREATYCVLANDGRILEEGPVPMNRLALQGRFGAGPAARVVLEAPSQSQWVARFEEGLGHEVIVADPRQVHLISKNERKCDRNDALLLARLGRVDPQLLRPTTTRSEKSAVVRALLSARSQLVKTRTCLINLVRFERQGRGSSHLQMQP